MPRLYIGSLCEHLSSTFSDIAVVSFYKEALFPAEETDRLKRIGVTVRQFDHKNPIGYLINVSHAYSILKNRVSHPSDHVFICQPNHLLTNYFAFGKPNTARPWSVHLIPDGAANFYMPDTSIYERGMRRKRYVGKLIGIPFTEYRGLYLGIDSANYSDYYYSGDPGLMEGLLPLEQFALEKPSNVVKVANSCLFLGQPVGTGAAQSAYIDELSRVANCNFDRLVYRPHPAENDVKIRGEIEALGFNFEQSSQAGETYALGFEYVVAVNSSVLLNLYMMGWHRKCFYLSDSHQMSVISSRSEEECSLLVSSFREMGVSSIEALVKERNSLPKDQSD